MFEREVHGEKVGRDEDQRLLPYVVCDCLHVAVGPDVDCRVFRAQQGDDALVKCTDHSVIICVLVG